MTEERAFLFPEVLDRIRFPHSLLFLQLGSFHRPYSLMADLVSEASRRGLEPIVVERCSDSLPDLSADAAANSLVILDTFEQVLDARTDPSLLGRIRPLLTETRQTGARILLLSRFPSARYPATIGSSLIQDAQLFTIRGYEPIDGSAFLAARGIASESHVRLHQHAEGSAALLERYAVIEQMDASGNEKMAASRRAIYEVALRTYDEIGHGICAWLEHIVYEQGTNYSEIGDVPAEFRESVVGAGIARPESTVQGERLHLLPDAGRDIWLAALGDYLESVVSASPSWRDLASELFAIERLIRRMLAAQYRSRLGEGWAPVILNNRLESVLSQVARDATPTATSFGDVRSPLDWITLEGLIELARSESQVTGSAVGTTAAQWSELSTVLVPIRNRFAHMRIARVRDLETVRNAHRMLRLRLRASIERGEADWKDRIGGDVRL